MGEMVTVFRKREAALRRAQELTERISLIDLFRKLIEQIEPFFEPLRDVIQAMNGKRCSGGTCSRAA
jgi:hypothetical protein